MLFVHVGLRIKRALLWCPFGTKSEKFYNQEISLSLFEGKNSFLGRVLMPSTAECERSILFGVPRQRGSSQGEGGLPLSDRKRQIAYIRRSEFRLLCRDLLQIF